MASSRVLLLVALLAVVLLMSKVSSEIHVPTTGSDAQEDTDPAMPHGADKLGNAEYTRDVEDLYNMDHDNGLEDGFDNGFDRSFVVLGH